MLLVAARIFELPLAWFVKGAIWHATSRCSARFYDKVQPKYPDKKGAIAPPPSA